MKENYHALVDMGSNGIRFSISDLNPLTARLLPTIYQDRSPISLYDAQYSNGEKVPIPDSVVQKVISAFHRFKRTYQAFLVPEQNVRIVATEATRNAINGKEFLNLIDRDVGWRVQLLSKEEEGRLGALGIASSLPELQGLVIDMGGGSIQLSRVYDTGVDGIYIGREGPISLPLGAAALSAEISQCKTAKDRDSHRESIVKQIRKAVEGLVIDATASIDLYLSGGGFRGWGHALMASDPIQDYPIPIINGYSIVGSRLLPDGGISKTMLDSHRISKRRASQLPSVQMALKALQTALAPIKLGNVTFCQGGIREGLLFRELSKEIQAQHPLVAATKCYGPPSASQIFKCLKEALPREDIIDHGVLEATVNLLCLHASYPKDIQASSALRFAITGALANAHGLLHQDRALLSLVLCERYGGKISRLDQSFRESLEAVVGPQKSWWAKFVGYVASTLADLYPAGLVPEDEEPVKITSALKGDQDQHWEQQEAATRDEGTLRFVVEVSIAGPDDSNYVEDLAQRLRKLGKRKAQPHHTSGWAMCVDVSVLQREDQ